MWLCQRQSRSWWSWFWGNLPLCNKCERWETIVDRGQHMLRTSITHRINSIDRHIYSGSIKVRVGWKKQQEHKWGSERKETNTQCSIRFWCLLTWMRWLKYTWLSLLGPCASEINHQSKCISALMLYQSYEKCQNL